MNNLKDTISKLPKVIIIKLLKKQNVRNYYLDDNNYLDLIELLKLLRNELHLFLDNKFLEDILKSSKKYQIMTALSYLDIDYLSELFANDMAIDYILKNGLNFCHYNYIFGRVLIDYAIKNNCFILIRYITLFKKEEQRKIFDSEYIIKIVNHSDKIDKFFFYICPQVQYKLLIHKSYLDKFLGLDLSEIDILIEKKNFIIPFYLYHNEELINKYVNVGNIDLYHSCVNNLLTNNYELYVIIENKYKRKVHKFLELVKKQGFDEKISFDYLYDMLIEHYFKDYPYNFLANLKVMLSYEDCSNIICKDNLDFYNKILNKDIDIINMFDDNINYAKMFYEDYQKCKINAYNKMNDYVIKLNKSNELYNQVLSKKYGVDIYELKGEDFYAFAHSTQYSRNDSCIFWLENDTLSLSLIGKNNITTYQKYEGNDNITFGFNSLNPCNIMHVYYSDSYTSGNEGTDKINQILNPPELLKKTLGYNEILYYEKNLSTFKPDYIICYDRIESIEIAMAKSNNIPIVFIHSLAYENKKNDGLVEERNKNVYKIKSRYY